MRENNTNTERYIYLFFIDHKKCNSKGTAKNLLELQGKLDLLWHHIRKNLRWKQATCIRIATELRKYVKVEGVVGLVFIFIPDLLNLSSEVILRAIEVLPGFIISLLFDLILKT